VTTQLRDFLEYLRLNRNASAHTVSAYESDVSQFLAFAAQHLDTAIDALEPSQLQLGPVRAFMADLYRQGHARASVARKLSAMRAFGLQPDQVVWGDRPPRSVKAIDLSAITDDVWKKEPSRNFCLSADAPPYLLAVAGAVVRSRYLAPGGCGSRPGNR